MLQLACCDCLAPLPEPSAKPGTYWPKRCAGCQRRRRLLQQSAANRRYYEANRERICADRRERYWRDPESFRARSRANRALDKAAGIPRIRRRAA